MQCTYTHTYMLTSTYTHTHTHTHTHIHTHTHTHLPIDIHLHTHTPTNRHIHTPTDELIACVDLKELIADGVATCDLCFPYITLIGHDTSLHLIRLDYSDEEDVKFLMFQPQLPNDINVSMVVCSGSLLTLPILGILIYTHIY